MTDRILWSPSEARKAGSNLVRLMAEVSAGTGQSFDGYEAFHRFSVERRDLFWSALWDFCGVIGDKGTVLLGQDTMPGAEFFPQARLNFAENLLRARPRDEEVMTFDAEGFLQRRVTFGALSDQVSRLQQAMRAAGVSIGDRVAAMMPNGPEAIAIMLAATSLGAVFSSCSPDFGERGVLDRFGQIEPKLFFACDGYWYAGKRLEILGKLAPIVEGLPTAGTVIIVDHIGIADAVSAMLPRATTMAAFAHGHAPAPLFFERLPFNHPLYILFSSGTTGVPKCIVHGAGGTLLQHLKEQQIQCDIKPGDRFFYFTTCGWMMWNWLVSGLASGAKLILFDGSPFHPVQAVLFDLAERERVTFFGTSAKYIDTCLKAGLKPIATHDLSSVRSIASTGSPLSADGFSYIYDSVKADVQLASISGGTDIVSCFVGGNPFDPVRVGEIQCAGLGMAVEIWDEAGKPVTGEKGELVCTRAFPSMPVQFWNDPDGAKYRAAYFERFPGVWCHGDFAERTASGGFIIHGRSDATLNPGGVRIGTAEIYAQVERVPEVIEALAIGQDWDNDVRVVLFVRLREGVALDEALTAKIKTAIRVGASPRHVPARIVAVADIPRTKSGKITELAVREVVHGRPVKNQEALANPDALQLFANLPELAQ